MEGPSGAQHIATILFFCALKEALLDRFLLDRMRAERLPERISKRLLADNPGSRQRFEALFNSVVGESWKDAVGNAGKEIGLDLGVVSSLMIKAARVRNKFMHEGVMTEVAEEFAEQCYNRIGSMLTLFALLHNLYVGPLLSPKK